MRNAQTIKTPAGEDMVILPKADYDRLLAAARDKLEDDEDAREAARILARLDSGEEETLPFEIVKRLRTENRVKVLREYRGLTQRELAHAADMNPLYLSQIECGRATGGIKAHTRLAKALSVKVDLVAPAIPAGREIGTGRRAR